MLAAMIVPFSTSISRRAEHDILLGGFAGLILQGLLEFLAFLDDRLHALGNLFIIIELGARCDAGQLGNGVIAFGFDLGDVRIDPRPARGPRRRSRPRDA